MLFSLKWKCEYQAHIMTEIFIPVTRKLPLLMSQMLVSKGKTQPNRLCTITVYTLVLWVSGLHLLVLWFMFPSCSNLFSFSKKKKKSCVFHIRVEQQWNISRLYKHWHHIVRLEHFVSEHFRLWMHVCVYLLRMLNAWKSMNFFFSFFFFGYVRGRGLAHAQF